MAPIRKYNADKIVCSHHLFVHLSNAMPKVAHAVLNDERLSDIEYHKIGTFTNNDILKITSKFKDLFDIQQLHPEPTNNDDS
jgi:hypothetical protein